METKSECAVCKQILINHVGSTECCGSIAYRLNEEGQSTKSVQVYASINGETPTILTIGLKD